MGEYKKKPVVIEAIQFTGKNFFEIHKFTNGNAHDYYTQPEGYTTCIINTLEGIHIATEGDYIIKGVQGEFYPCKPDIFAETYEVADRPKTNADRIRAMSDEELAKNLYNIDNPDGYCRNLPECDALLDTEGGIPEERCITCLLEWLKQPVEEE